MAGKRVKRGVVLTEEGNAAVRNYKASVRKEANKPKADGATFGPSYGERPRRAGIKLKKDGYGC